MGKQVCSLFALLSVLLGLTIDCTAAPPMVQTAEQPILIQRVEREDFEDYFYPDLGSVGELVLRLRIINQEGEPVKGLGCAWKNLSCLTDADGVCLLPATGGMLSGLRLYDRHDPSGHNEATYLVALLPGLTGGEIELVWEGPDPEESRTLRKDRLELRVVDQNGIPWPNLCVALRKPWKEGDPLHGSYLGDQLDTDGRIVWSDVAPGQWELLTSKGTLSFDYPGGVNIKTLVAMRDEPGETGVQRDPPSFPPFPKNNPVSNQNWVGVQVFNKWGSVLRGARLWLELQSAYTQEEKAAGPVYADSWGCYVWTDQKPGRYLLRAADGPYGEQFELLLDYQGGIENFVLRLVELPDNWGIFRLIW